MSSDIYHIKCQAGFFFAELTNLVFLEAEEGNISPPCHTVTFPMEAMRMVRKMMMTIMMIMMMTLTKSRKLAGD